MSGYFYIMNDDSSEEHAQKKIKLDKWWSSLILAFESQYDWIFDECYAIDENLEFDDKVICKNCATTLGTKSKNAAYLLNQHLSSNNCLEKMSLEKQSLILLAKLPGQKLDDCYEILKSGKEINVHCICCRDCGKSKIMKASAQNVVSNLQQHSDSHDHQVALQKSINATNKNFKQTSMTSFVSIVTAPMEIVTNFPLNTIPGLLCHGYFHNFVQYGKVKHSLDFLGNLIF